MAGIQYIEKLNIYIHTYWEWRKAPDIHPDMTKCCKQGLWKLWTAQMLPALILLNTGTHMHIHTGPCTHTSAPPTLFRSLLILSCSSICPSDFWPSQKTNLISHCIRTTRRWLLETSISCSLNSSEAAMIIYLLASISYSNDEKSVVQLWESFVQSSSLLFIKMHEIWLRSSGNWGTTLFQWQVIILSVLKVEYSHWFNL